MTDANGVATSPAITAGTSTGQWTATVYFTAIGGTSDARTAYYVFTNRLL
jgi:hypothetical protein